MAATGEPGDRWSLHNRPEEQVRQILGGTAAKLYSFDLGALAPVAAEIGPTVEEVATPLGDTGYLARPRSITARSRAAWPSGASPPPAANLGPYGE
jgi:hypothetical protein